METLEPSTATAILGGGCFWCIEAAYEEIEGVHDVIPGYAGGRTPNPTYEEVCSGTTGHAEVVKVVFDPGVISYRDILRIFFTVHDPTTLNRQGADVGTQYRSVIFYTDQEQRRIAEEVMAELGAARVWVKGIVTELSPAGEFYEAEAYHRNYYRRNPNQPYCQVVIAPKLAKLRKEQYERLRRGGGAARAEGSPQVRSFQDHPQSPVDHGGIAD